MYAARIVTEHPANRAMVVGRGIGAKNEPVLFRLHQQFIEHDSRLHSRKLSFCIDLEDAIHVLREINDDGDVTALAGQAGSAATTRDGSAEFSAKGDYRDDVVAIARNDDADRQLPVVRAVGRVKR